jgi:hypothetical protein
MILTGVESVILIAPHNFLIILSVDPLEPLSTAYAIRLLQTTQVINTVSVAGLVPIWCGALRNTVLLRIS